MGTRKLYELLESFMLEHQIKMGRDALFNLLANNHLLVKRRKRRIHTTNSNHWFRKYRNLIKDFTPSQSNELWVSDITYWKTNERVYYISLITDAYSHKVVGYQVAETLEAAESIEALKMALASIDPSQANLIHHSDRGIQYCCHQYVNLLQDNAIKISMTESGDPRDNAIAERINGILKNEYLYNYEVDNINMAKELLDSVVKLYNEERPHMSIGNNIPNEVHLNNTQTNKLWKSYYSKKPIIVNQYQD
jgi:transposase InsO family protein